MMLFNSSWVTGSRKKLSAYGFVKYSLKWFVEAPSLSINCCATVVKYCLKDTATCLLSDVIVDTV